MGGYEDPTKKKLEGKTSSPRPESRKAMEKALKNSGFERKEASK
jgi:hypothetical protein